MVYAAVDFGGTNIKLGLLQEGRVLTFAKIPAFSDKGLLSRMKMVEDKLREMALEISVPPNAWDGIGIALPGLVDTDARKLLTIHEKYTDAADFSFTAWADKTFALPLVMENDARAALVGETAYGTARGEQDAVLMIFGTGIGTAAMINGRILRGRHYQAGILGGHMSLESFGPICNCGNQGCLEELASHRTLLIRAQEDADYTASILASWPRWGYEELTAAWLEGDSFAQRFLKQLVTYWSAGLVNLIHAYDPETVILSGGLMKSAPIILPLLREGIERKAWSKWGTLKVLVADQPERSVLLGLARIFEKEALGKGGKSHG